MELEGFLNVGALNLEYRRFGPTPSEAPTIIMLHEGLGSAGLWGDFPERLQAETGLGVLAYSRAGYGQSSPVPLPRPHDYMHREALDVLPNLLNAIGFQRGILLGHSDGASISTIYGGGVSDSRIAGIALIAPHFVVEDISLASIVAVQQTYEASRGDSKGLRARLAHWHRDVDNAFYGWNGAWLDPGFRTWDISEYLAHVRVPLLILQGADDQYGTLRQIEIAREECSCPLEVTVMPGAGHSPHREAPQVTLQSVAVFVGRALS